MSEKIQLNTIEPFYEQIYNYLNKLIVDKVLNPGDKLPSEKELESIFDVSRITIRRAIQELVYENKVVRIAGKGSFVLKPKIEPLSALTSFSENMIAQGYDPSYKNSIIEIINPHATIAKQLKIECNEKVLKIFRLMLASKTPMAIHYDYLPPYVYKKNPDIFIPELLNKISLYKLLELELGINLFRAEERVDASIATKEESEILDIQEEDSILVIERITYDVNDIPIEYAKLIYPANRYRYKVELFRSGDKRENLWKEDPSLKLIMIINQ